MPDPHPTSLSSSDQVPIVSQSADFHFQHSQILELKFGGSCAKQQQCCPSAPQQAWPAVDTQRAIAINVSSSSSSHTVNPFQVLSSDHRIRTDRLCLRCSPPHYLPTTSLRRHFLFVFYLLCLVVEGRNSSGVCRSSAFLSEGSHAQNHPQATVQRSSTVDCTNTNFDGVNSASPFQGVSGRHCPIARLLSPKREKPNSSSLHTMPPPTLSLSTYATASAIVDISSKPPNIPLFILELFLFALASGLAFFQGQKAYRQARSNATSSVVSSGNQARPWFLLMLAAALMLRFLSLLFGLWPWHVQMSADEGNVEQLSGLRVWFHVLGRSIPSLTFLSAYTQITVFWAEIIHKSDLVEVPLLRPFFLFVNAILYLLFIVVALVTLLHEAYGRFRQYAMFFVGTCHLAVAFSWLYYGFRVVLRLRERSQLALRLGHPPLPSLPSRMFLLCSLCPVLFAIQGAYNLFVSFGFIPTYYPLPNNSYRWYWDATVYLSTEWLPSMVIVAVFWKYRRGVTPIPSFSTESPRENNPSPLTVVDSSIDAFSKFLISSTTHQSGRLGKAIPSSAASLLEGFPTSAARPLLNSFESSHTQSTSAAFACMQQRPQLYNCPSDNNNNNCNNNNCNSCNNNCNSCNNNCNIDYINKSEQFYVATDKVPTGWGGGVRGKVQTTDERKDGRRPLGMSFDFGAFSNISVPPPVVRVPVDGRRSSIPSVANTTSTKDDNK